MLLKIFGRKEASAPSIFPGQPKPVPMRQSRALKIVHAGGHAEYYYMAIPASMIIEKHHSFILARPEIFRRPWESVVRPEEILIPGQRYYLVPRRTVKKLRRRIRRISPTDPGTYSHPQDSISSISGILVKPGRKMKARDRHVRWFDIANQKPGSASHGINKDGKERLKKPSPVKEKHTRARNENAWEPSLQSIDE